MIPRIIGYRHTGIIVNDIQKSLYFYRDILGFNVIQDYTDNSDYINKIVGLKNANIHMVKLEAPDRTIIEIVKYINHPTGNSENQFYNVGTCHIAFQINDAEKVWEKLNNHDVPVISKPILSSENIAKVFFCIDPDGVRIELVEMLEN